MSISRSLVQDSAKDGEVEMSKVVYDKAITALARSGR